MHVVSVHPKGPFEPWLEQIGNVTPDQRAAFLEAMEKTNATGLPASHPWSVGLCHLMALRVDDLSAIAVLRPPTDLPFASDVQYGLERIQPHIERAARIASSLSTIRIKPTVDALTALGLPTVILDCEGRPMVGNDLLQQLAPGIVRLDEGRLIVSDPKADQLLARVFRETSPEPATVRSIAMSSRQGQLPNVLHLIPISQEPTPLDRPARWVVVVTSARSLPVPRRSVLAAIFSLTPAEAKVAQLLAKSQTADEIAQNLQIGRETARTHIKSIMEKAGVRRHIDFVRIVSGLHSLPLLGKRTHL